MIFSLGLILAFLLIIANIIWLDIVLLKRKTSKEPAKNTIVPSDAASALVHKALKHLVEGCESHMAVCPYREESLNGLIAFSREVLSRDMTSNGIMRMANLEERLLQAQDKYHEILKLAGDPAKLEQHLKKECFCGTTRQCQQHVPKV